MKHWPIQPNPGIFVTFFFCPVLLHHQYSLGKLINEIHFATKSLECQLTKKQGTYEKAGGYRIESSASL